MRKADVLILKNICDPDILPLIRERKEQNKLTVYESADNLCAIPPWNPVHFFYKNQENLTLFKRIAHYCDAMQFSVSELQKLYGYLNPCSAVFPNQISDVPPERNFQDLNETVTGALNEYYSFLKEIDIGLGPLKNTAFNRSRSDVKFLEYAIYNAVPGLTKQILPSSNRSSETLINVTVRYPIKKALQ